MEPNNATLYMYLKYWYSSGGFVRRLLPKLLPLELNGRRAEPKDDVRPWSNNHRHGKVACGTGMEGKRWVWLEGGVKWGLKDGSSENFFWQLCILLFLPWRCWRALWQCIKCIQYCSCIVCLGDWSPCEPRAVHCWHLQAVWWLWQREAAALRGTKVRNCFFFFCHWMYM